MSHGGNALMVLFCTKLGVQPTRAQVALFEADLARASHELLHDALRELEGAGVRDRSANDMRAVVRAVYYRKLAEVTRLFPIFFTFETAFRAFTAARMAAIYGGDDWWVPIEHAVRHKQDCLVIPSLNGRFVPRSTLRSIGRVFKGLHDAGTSLPVNGYGAISSGTMALVAQLIDQHWSDMVSAFHPSHANRSKGRITRKEFSDLFKVVRLARNDAYHHRSVSGQARVVAISEELLDLLDIHLGDACRSIQDVKIKPLHFHIAREPRHS